MLVALTMSYAVGEKIYSKHVAKRYKKNILKLSPTRMDERISWYHFNKEFHRTWFVYALCEFCTEQIEKIKLKKAAAKLKVAPQQVTVYNRIVAAQELSKHIAKGDKLHKNYKDYVIMRMSAETILTLVEQKLCSLYHCSDAPEEGKYIEDWRTFNFNPQYGTPYQFLYGESIVDNKKAFILATNEEEYKKLMAGFKRSKSVIEKEMFDCESEKVTHAMRKRNASYVAKLAADGRTTLAEDIRTCDKFVWHKWGERVAVENPRTAAQRYTNLLSLVDGLSRTENAIVSIIPVTTAVFGEVVAQHACEYKHVNKLPAGSLPKEKNVMGVEQDLLAANQKYPELLAVGQIENRTAVFVPQSLEDFKLCEKIMKRTVNAVKSASTREKSFKNFAEHQKDDIRHINAEQEYIQALNKEIKHRVNAEKVPDAVDTIRSAQRQLESPSIGSIMRSKKDNNADNIPNLKL